MAYVEEEIKPLGDFTPDYWLFCFCVTEVNAVIPRKFLYKFLASNFTMFNLWHVDNETNVR